MLCKHENILQYWQSFVDDEERLWVITEPVRVGSVRRLMDEHFQNGLQNEIIVATILRDLLCAVQYMHDKNYIHKYVVLLSHNIIHNDSRKIMQ
jgi:serine/threonine-protein kinase OSR1/STK39